MLEIQLIRMCCFISLAVKMTRRHSTGSVEFAVPYKYVGMPDEKEQARCLLEQHDVSTADLQDIAAVFSAFDDVVVNWGEIPY